MMETKPNTVNQDTWGIYSPQLFESKWQRYWEDNGFYMADQTSEKPKYYCLDFFPYPSGEGLHVGHCRNYIPTDLLSRFMRMRGYNVLHPMGWDAFGEPTEQFAESHGIHPRESTDQNTSNFRRQMTMIGTSYDWSREIDSSDPSFYRWTQWFFLMLYKRGLAYRDPSWQWWCPTCQTTLSSHEAAGGVCWRGHTRITKREIPAWYFRITEYADELLTSLDDIDWPEKIKSMQRNWIGRSEGYEIDFKFNPYVDPRNSDFEDKVAVFTTRPDTLYGATFFVLAPEHPIVDELTKSKHRSDVETYRDQASRKSEVERMMENREKSGVFTGGYVVNPLNGERLPVWIADYVLPGYGSGAVMGVPAHDQRDFEFAKKYRIPIRQVIVPPGQEYDESLEMEQAYPGEGYLVNSGGYTGLSSLDAIRKMAESLEADGLARRTVQYRIRDWLISRQRYWGTPIPIIHCDDCGTVPVPEEQLPVLLPDMVDFLPDGSGQSPLARLPDFVNTTCPDCGGAARRETDTMGGFACSSWYFLRFISPEYDEGPFEPAAMRYWMPVDLYVGGAEHAVLHLLYSRFWVKVMADAELVSFREPFSRLLSQGQMMGPDGQRMSKSRGNVVTPDQIVDVYGADALRVYELFMAPFEQDVDWSIDGIKGAWRFLNRLWNLYNATFVESAASERRDQELDRRLHKTIREVTQRIPSVRVNTMVSTFMEFSNYLLDHQQKGTWRTASYHQALKTLMVLMAPMTPHISEELWHLTGQEGSVHNQPWPDWDPDLAQDEIAQIAIQVNGRLRHVLDITVDADRDEVVQAALARDEIQQFVGGRKVVSMIFVPGKVLNILT